ncbi:MAG: hypothetical protein KGH64_04905, partial [Candidatus Micrarchaeota archaeon]|nr:hypothetical protein [Candidatus Micrarchaeota archaeon]
KGFDIMPSFPQQVKLSLTLANGTTIIVSKQNQTISLSGNPTALFPMTLTANIITFNNQLQGNVFLDGTTVNSLNFGFSKTFTTLTAGLESFILNSTGDGNYMPVDPSIDLTVLSPTTTVSSGCTGGCVRGSGGTGVTYTTSPSTSVATTTTPPTTTMPAAINGSFHASYNLTATSPLAINASNLGISLTIGSSSSSEASVIISNDTNSSPSAPSGFSKLLTANISISTQANISTNVTLHYPCSVNSSRVAPYKLVNGSWKRISQFQLDSNSCAITFSITKDPIVGLFQNTTHTTTIATTSPSTMPTTITTQSNNTSAQQSSSGTSSTLLIVVVVIVIIIIAVYLLKGRK